jgi:hypothetical protein
MKRFYPLLGVLVMLGASFAWSGSAAAGDRTACRGGNVAPGTYDRLVITGNCVVRRGLVSVRGDLLVASRAVLNATLNGTVRVGGDVVVRDGAVLGLGCDPGTGCTPTSDRVRGSLISSDALAVIVHFVTIDGSVSITGGGGGVTCRPQLFGGPAFDAFEDSTVQGSVTVARIRSCWFGFIRNHVGHRVLLHDNRLADPDAMEVVTNVIGGNLACFENSPAAQVGDSQGLPNQVGGKKAGECAKL